ncbi:MaoC family dehydratase N-terminal domain-containing protein [Bdellovibrionota bacterium FG-2]
MGSLEWKQKVGLKKGPFEEPLTQERVQDFWGALGVVDRGRARGVPPTFLTVCRQGEFELFQEFGVPLSSLLHAGQEYRYFGEIEVGDVLIFETTLKEVLEKKGKSGLMRFLVFETAVQARKSGGGVVRVALSNTNVVIKVSEKAAS